MMGLSILGGEHRGGQSPVNVRRGARSVFQLIMAGDPPNLAGGEVRALGEREAHWLIADVVSLQGGRRSAPIPAGSLPTVPLHTAAVDLIGIEAIIEVEAIEVEDLARGVLNLREAGVEFHGSFRLIDLSLQGHSAPRALICATLAAVTASRVWAVWMIAPAVWENMIRMPAIRERRTAFAMGRFVLMLLVYRVRIASAIELCQTAGCHMGGAAAGAIELYHALCLGQGGEPLRAPLASVVGGLVTDFDSHGLSVVDAVSLQGQRRRSGEAVTVHPLSQGEGADSKGAQHGAAGDAFEAIDLPAAGELHPSGARDRIDGQAMDGAAVLTDSEDHWLVV
jgi:hypothetical protein